MAGLVGDAVAAPRNEAHGLVSSTLVKLDAAARAAREGVSQGKSKT